MSKFYKNKLLLSLSLFIAIISNSQAQYTVTTGSTATDMVNELVGDGVTIVSSSINCESTARGIFSGTGDLGIDSGIVMTSGTASTLFGPFLFWGDPSQVNLYPGDPDLDALVSDFTNDACVLQFQFVPTGDSVSFNYVFGSSEYGSYSCTIFNDVFGFFISGPGIAGTQNLAVIPGTTIPVTVNSTTGVGSWVSSDPGCTSMGAGSPFSSYYVDNTSGAFIAYGGFTTKFVAQSPVIPCSTYTLKLAIGDVGDYSLDSGVFLEAGSLNSNGVTVATTGGGGLSFPNSNAVRGCTPGNFTITRSGSTASPATLSYILEGTAVNGVDYVYLPGTVTIPSGSSSVSIPIDPIVLPTLVGTKSVVAKIINPFACGDTIIADTIYIYDSLYVDINVDDTTICLGSSVDLTVSTLPVFSTTWTPTSALSYTPDIYHVTSTPTASTSYVVSVNVPGSGCGDATDTVNIEVVEPPILILEDSLEICAGESIFAFPIYATSASSPTFTWTPPTGVSDPFYINPEFSPTSSTNYVLTIGNGVPGCETSDSLYITVNTDNTTFENDTVCSSSFPYTWEGETISGPGMGVATISFPSASSTCDSVIVLNVFVTPPTTTVEVDSICSGELPYSWHGISVSSTGLGVASDTTSSILTGCDSITTLNLFLLPNINTTLTETICAGGSFTFGSSTYSSTGIYVDTFPSFGGCDSIVTLNLTVLPNETDTFDVSICSGSSYSFYGTSYTSAGTYTHLETSGACDTLFVLNLSLTDTIRTTGTESICTGGSIVIDGSTISTAGVYPFYYTTAAGCDSLHTVTVSVDPLPNDTLDASICSGSSYSFFGTSYSSPGTYTHLETSGACDTMFVLNLSMTDTIRTTGTESICTGGSIVIDGSTITSAGVYPFYYTTASGCDSLHTVTVSVDPLPNDTLDASICSGSSYSFFGTSYSSPGTYTHLETSGACDTMFVLNLSMTDTIRTTGTESICTGGSIVIDGSTISTGGVYPFYYTTASGCDSLHTVTISVDPVPNDTLDASICSGSSYSFFGTSYSSPGTYTHLETSGACDTMFVLNLSMTDTIRTTGTESICTGGSIVIDGSTITSAGVYPFYYTTASGCDSLHTVTVSVDPLPNDTLDASICSGSSYSFFGTSYSSPGTYTHLETSGPCDTMFVLNLSLTDTVRTYQTENICTGGAYIWSGISYTSAGVYPLYGTSAGGCDTLHTLTILVDPMPSDTIDASICSGSSYSFYGSSYSSAGTYTHTETSGACDTMFVLNLTVTDTIRTYQTENICTGGAYIWSGVSYTSAGVYPLYGTSAGGCDTLHILTLIVDPMPSDTIDALICSGSSYSFYGTSYSSTGIYTHTETSGACDTMFVLNLSLTDTVRTYQTENICTGGAYIWSGVSYTTAGVYPLYGTSAGGCDTLHTLTILVDPMPSDTIDASICSGSSYSFYGSSYSSAGTYTHTETSGACDTMFVLNLSMTDTVRTYQTENICTGGAYIWSGVSYTTAGVYPLYGTSAGGCDTLHTLTILVDPMPSDTVDASICSGSSYSFYGSSYSSAGTYTHTGTSGACDTMFVLNLLVNDTLRAYDTQSICEGGSISIAGTSITTAGVYPFYFSTSAGCDSLFTLTVNVDPLIYDSTIASICDGNSYDFYGTSLSSAGVYTHLSTDGACDTMRVINLTVNPTYLSSQDYTFCRNELPTTILGISIPISASSTLGYDTAVFTTINGCDSSIIINLTIFDTNSNFVDTFLCYGTTYNWGGYTIDEGGIFTHTFTNMNGCDSVVQLTINYSPEPTTIDSAITGCGFVDFLGDRYFEDTTFIDTITNSIGCDSLYYQTHITILYSPNDTFFVNICEGESYTFDSKVYNSSTTVTATFVYDNGCDSLSTMVLTVFPKPNVSLLYTPFESLCVLDTIQLIGQGAIDYRYYDRNNNYLGTGDSVEVILPGSNNQYYVQGTDENGCSAMANLNLFAEPCCAILIPNAFSPNGDGINDGFGVVTEGHPDDFRLEIYNRWGERVFVCYKPEVKWDGYYQNGKPADIGTYFFTVKSKCFDGTNFFKKGDISLIR